MLHRMPTECDRVTRTCIGKVNSLSRLIMLALPKVALSN